MAQIAALGFWSLGSVGCRVLVEGPHAVNSEP